VSTFSVPISAEELTYCRIIVGRKTEAGKRFPIGILSSEAAVGRKSAIRIAGTDARDAISSTSAGTYGHRIDDLGRDLEECSLLGASTMDEGARYMVETWRDILVSRKAAGCCTHRAAALWTAC